MELREREILMTDSKYRYDLEVQSNNDGSGDSLWIHKYVKHRNRREYITMRFCALDDPSGVALDWLRKNKIKVKYKETVPARQVNEYIDAYDGDITETQAFNLIMYFPFDPEEERDDDDD